MQKLNIKIKINELEELKLTIDYIKSLRLNEIPELNSEITIEFGYDN